MKHCLSATVLLCALLFCSAFLEAEEFFYKHRAGDKYRILSTVREDVYLDRRLSHRALILNRIAVTVESFSGGEGRSGISGAGRARLSAVFDTAETTRSPLSGGDNRSFSWSREYHSVFDRDELGFIYIDRQYFMPVVRNVPVFPRRDIKPGDSWTAEGHEAHDFRDSFGIPDPYRIPFTANYRYLGEREWKGNLYPAIEVRYRIQNDSPEARGPLWPRRIRGASDQLIFWDRELGQPRSYREQFSMAFELANGRIIEYRGEAEAEILEAEIMDKERLAKEITEAIEELEDVSVRIDDKGVTISLEDIQFLPDSARLMASELAKLDRIAEILGRYAGRDIEVAGHTALAGTAAGREKLSGERAAAVADYFIGKGVRSADRVIIRAYGAERPAADNATEEGRRRNRRVEITILEN
ncbi:MAG: OmpA family protein [Spirochaetaceae bacterium]|jgi:outer membrane protein OmpA-like peptidoglycan-associated protein|nr:OmpA family protein [Spirochaetaceae bacterium]